MAVYNQIADPSQTNQEEFGVRGGVCMRYGKYQNNFKMTFKFVFYYYWHVCQILCHFSFIFIITRRVF